MSELNDKLITYGNLSTFYDKLQEQGIGGSTTIESITYAQLKTKRDNGELVKGQRYRITDYVTTTAQENTRSAEHPFDLIVTAVDTDKLSDTGVKVINTSGDTYFVAKPIHYHIDGDSYAGFFNYDGTIEIDNVTYYKWYCEDVLGAYATYILTTQQTYTNTPDGEDEDGEYYLTVYPFAGFIYDDGEEEVPVEEYDSWIRKKKSIIKTEEVNNTLYLVIGDSFLESTQTYQSQYAPNLAAWEAKYCLDNDTTRFAWAQEGDEGTNLPAIQVGWNQGTYYKWLIDINDGMDEYYALTTQRNYSNIPVTEDDETYYTTAYEIDGYISVGEEPTEPYKGGKYILYTDNDNMYLGDEYDYGEGEGKYTPDIWYEGTYSGTYIQYEKYIYIRYPQGDENGQYAWAYCVSGDEHNLSDLTTDDFNDIDTNDLIFSTSLQPSIGDILDMSGDDVTVLQYTSNAGFIPEGKGTIYYLKDEWNNEAEYDFKNMLFKQGFWAIQASDGDSRIYKRYPEGDNADNGLYAFVFVNGSDEYTIEDVENNSWMWDDIDTTVIIYFYNSIPSSGDYDVNGDFEVVDSKMISLGYKFTFGEASDEPIDDSLKGGSHNNTIQDEITDEVKYIPVLNLGNETVDYGKGGGESYELPVANANTLGGVKVGGYGIEIGSDNILRLNYTLPTASDSTLGGIKVGTGLEINNGVLSLSRDIIRFIYDLYPDNQKYLTYEADEDNCEVYFYCISNSSSDRKNISISKNLLTWETKQSSNSSNGTLLATLNKGERLYVRGDNSNYNNNRIINNKECYVFGNIMSLIDSDDFVNLYSFTEQYAFTRFFTGKSLDGTKIKSHDKYKLVLPATSLTPYCYNNMFYNCRSLTTAPELPATALTDSCYYGMFQDCTSLTEAPELPAATLAYQCYRYMFEGCIRLTTAPELPATTLAERCYTSMFEGCSSLTAAPVLSATTLGDNFNCYARMFYGCTNINSITMLATSLSASADSYLFYWVSGVSATGTFTKAAGMTLPTGVSGIPDGWTVVDV